MILSENKQDKAHKSIFAKVWLSEELDFKNNWEFIVEVVDFKAEQDCSVPYILGAPELNSKSKSNKLKLTGNIVI